MGLFINHWAVNKTAHKPNNRYKMSTKLHITQQYVYKTANNRHVYKTCLKKAKKYTRVAPQQNVWYITQMYY
jgi:hypothetical protein